MGWGLLGKKARVLLCWVLIFTSVLPAQVFATTNSGQSVSREPSDFQRQLIQAWEDPFLSALKSQNEIPTQAPLDKKDPSLDEDPFFLRSQSWNTLPERNTSDSFSASENKLNISENKLSIQVQGLAGSLQLSVPLQPILFTDTHLFFSLKSNSNLFEKKKDLAEVDPAVLSEPAGEGIFFLNREELLSAGNKQKSVPIYFFPMPGDGWRGSQRAFQILDQNLVVFESTQGDLLPVQENDIEQIQQAERINLAMATGTAFRSAALSKQPIDAALGALPPVHSTAGFGMLFTGFDASNETLSVFTAQAKTGLWEQLQKLSPIKTANANLSSELMLQERILRVAMVVVVTLIASIVLKYTLFKKHFAQKSFASEEAKPGKLKNIRAEVEAVGSIFSHGLMTISQFAGVWFGNVVEFLSDRYAPSLLSGQNSLVRKFLVNTVFFVRDASKKIPVNLKVWLLGGLVFGATDTFLYYIQLYYIIFWVGQGIADHVPFLRERAQEAFEENNENNARLREYEVLATGTSYLTSGAFWFSADLQNQQIKMVEGEVEKAMLGEGKNSSLPQHSAEKERRVRERLESELKKAGLPGSESFLFDAHSLWESLFKFLGYDVPTNPKETAETYFAKSRPGLLIPTVKRAAEQAEKLAQIAERERNVNAEQARAAATLLKETLSKLRLLNLFVQAPATVLFPTAKAKASEGLKDAQSRMKNLLAEFKETRQQMVALSYEGSFDEEIKNIPSEWTQKIGENGAKVAGKIFRASLHSYLTGDLSVLPVPGPRAAKKEKPFKKPRVSAVARWQENKIMRLAQERYVQHTGQAFEVDTASESQKKLWKSIYAESYMNRFGLYPEYDDALIVKDKLEETAAAKVNQKINTDPRLKKILDHLQPQARELFLNQMHAEALVSEYVNETSSPQKATALSPAQPGRLQKLRQTKFLRGSKGLTRVARAVEALWPDHSVKPGLNAWLDRNVPGYTDFKLANERAYRSAVTGIGASYWFSKYFWLNALSPAMWLMSLVFRFTLGVPTQFLNRAFRMQGVQAMAKVRTVVVFAFIFTWATFWGAIPQQLFAADFNHAWDWGAEKWDRCRDILIGEPPSDAPPGTPGQGKIHSREESPLLPIPR